MNIFADYPAVFQRGRRIKSHLSYQTSNTETVVRQAGGTGLPTGYNPRWTEPPRADGSPCCSRGITSSSFSKLFTTRGCQLVPVTFFVS